MYTRRIAYTYVKQFTAPLASPVNMLISLPVSVSQIKILPQSDPETTYERYQEYRILRKCLYLMWRSRRLVNSWYVHCTMLCFFFITSIPFCPPYFSSILFEVWLDNLHQQILYLTFKGQTQRDTECSASHVDIKNVLEQFLSHWNKSSKSKDVPFLIEILEMKPALLYHCFCGQHTA